MKKQILAHVLFWLCYFAIDVVGYITIWSHKATIVSITLYALFLIIAYTCYFTTLQLFKRQPDLTDVGKKNKILLLAVLSIIYVGTAYYIDRFVLNNYYGPTVWAYCTMRFWAIMPFLFGIIYYLTNKNGNILIKRLKAEREQLKQEREAWMDERHVMLDDKMKLNSEINNLANEKTILECEIAAGRAHLFRIYDMYQKKQKELENYINLLDQKDF